MSFQFSNKKKDANKPSNTQQSSILDFSGLVENIVERLTTVIEEKINASMKLTSSPSTKEEQPNNSKNFYFQLLYDQEKYQTLAMVYFTTMRDLDPDMDIKEVSEAYKELLGELDPDISLRKLKKQEQILKEVKQSLCTKTQWLDYNFNVLENI